MAELQPPNTDQVPAPGLFPAAPQPTGDGGQDSDPGQRTPSFIEQELRQPVRLRVQPNGIFRDTQGIPRVAPPNVNPNPTATARLDLNQLLFKSPDALVHDIGQQAAIAAITSAAVELYPNDPAAVAVTVASALQKFMGSTGHMNTSSSQHQPGMTSRTPGQMSRISEGIILSSITETQNKNPEIAKYATTFPKFPPGDQTRDEPDVYEDYWEKIAGFQNILNCSDDFLALMIKHTSSDHQQLSKTLKRLKYSDGSLQQAGLAGIKKLIEEDFAPRGHTVKMKVRDRIFTKTFRKFKEKPRWFFKRVEYNLHMCQERDPDMNFSDDFLAHLYLHNCGLSRQEQKEVFDKADRQWDSEKIKQAILDLFDAAHELDEARVLRGRQHQRDPKNTYCVVHNDSACIEGTDLTPDLVEEPDDLEQIPQAETVFYPASTSTTYLVDQHQITSYAGAGYGTDY